MFNIVDEDSAQDSSEDESSSEQAEDSEEKEQPKTPVEQLKRKVRPDFGFTGFPKNPVAAPSFMSFAPQIN